jgi:hypothetical protein
MDTLTAEQKVRLQLTGDPFTDPHFQHEGEQVVHVLSGGSLPRAWVTYHHDGERITVRCAGCKQVLGSFPADYEPVETVRCITAIQLAGHKGHMPADWPFMNITNRRTVLE